MSLFESYRESYWESLKDKFPFGSRVVGCESLQTLLDSAKYATQSGGKRFRPILSLVTATELGGEASQALPYALALEMIHSYSLVHDDLPLMDDDDVRRGRPTLHKVYGEAMALLTGDGLLTEAFFTLADGYRHHPSLACELSFILSQAAGLRGMVAGQVLDVVSSSVFFDIEKKEGVSQGVSRLKLLHSLKTGSLIQASVEGGAVVACAPSDKKEILREFGGLLGLAFQVADDLEDSPSQIQNPQFKSTNFVHFLGQSGTVNFLKKISSQALHQLKVCGLGASRLVELIEMNERRGFL